MKKILLILLLPCLNLQGCTNYLYMGQIQAIDSDSKERQVILYWSKTRAMLAKAKAGPASLLTQCGSPIMFVEQPQGIVFRGTPGQDKLVIGETNNSTLHEIPCGSFINQRRFVDISNGSLMLTIFCEPISNDFSIGSKSYIQARQEPYQIDITSTKSWSLTGKVPEAPVPPSCNE
jgi:hypothetical protein